MKLTSRSLGAVAVTAILFALGVGSPAAAQDDEWEAGPPGQDRAEPLPAALVNVGIDEKLNGPLPLDAEFVDHTGRTVKLGTYFDGRRPVILTLNYYRCPMLCGLQLNSMTDTLKDLDWTIGDKFQVLTISFDPLESPPLAAIKRQNYLREYGRPEAAEGWHFLTGRKKSIDALLEASGYRVAWSEKEQQWLHVAALIICTPDGRISRYLVNLVYEPKTLRLSLVEASQGKIGTTLDHILLFCFHFDGEGYSLAAMNIARAGGGLSVVVVAGLLIGLWRRDRRRAGVQRGEVTADA